MWSGKEKDRCEAVLAQASAQFLDVWATLFTDTPPIIEYCLTVRGGVPDGPKTGGIDIGESKYIKVSNIEHS